MGGRGRGQAPGAGGSFSVATGDCKRLILGGGGKTLGLKILFRTGIFASTAGSESALGSSPQGTCSGHPQVKEPPCRSSADLMETQEKIPPSGADLAGGTEEEQEKVDYMLVINGIWGRTRQRRELGWGGWRLF